MRDDFIVLDYDTEKYPFQQILAKHVYKVPEINQLHKVWKKQSGKEKLTYKDNLRLRKLMQQQPDDSLFYRVYHKWIARVLSPHFGCRIRYSAHPKMRVHLAGTGCVSDFHRDVEVTKRYDQINCYLPFTDVYQTSTLWCEMDYNEENYQPLNLKYGQALLWDGGCLKHGTYFNKTDNTRLSCDFRFTPKDLAIVKSPWRDILSSRVEV